MSDQPSSFSTAWFDTQKAVAFTLVLSFVAILALWIIYKPTMTPEVKEVTLLLVGGLISQVTTAVNFLFRKD